MRWRVLVGVAALASSACVSKDVVTCDPAQQGADCLQGGITGTCVATCDGTAHYCGFPAPFDCPGSELKFGVLSGEWSARCVEECSLPADAGGSDANESDAQTPAPANVYVAGSVSDEMWLFDAVDLSSLGTVALPHGNRAGYSITLVGGVLWMSSFDQIAKYDLLSHTIPAGYPRYMDPAHTCDPYTSVFGPEGWTCLAGETLQRWTGEPLVSVKSRPVTAPDRLARSEGRILVAVGSEQTQVAAFDTVTLNPAPGSPVTTNKVFKLVADAGSDRILVLSLAGPGSIELLRESTLESLGKKDLSSTTSPLGAIFDAKRHRVIVGIGFGFITAYSTDDLSPVRLPSAVSSYPLIHFAYDAVRDRFYAAASSFSDGELVVLDGETLENVAGSPVPLPGPASSPVLY